MSKIKYPQDWFANASPVINYPALMQLAKVNGLNEGHLSYLVQAIQDTVLLNISKMKDDAQQKENNE